MRGKHIDIRVTALSNEDIKDFLILLRKISECGNQGMNRTINARVDGDGSGNYSFEVNGRNIDDFVILDPDEVKRVGDGSGNFEVYLGE